MFSAGKQLVSPVFNKILTQLLIPYKLKSMGKNLNRPRTTNRTASSSVIKLACLTFPRWRIGCGFLTLFSFDDRCKFYLKNLDTELVGVSSSIAFIPIRKFSNESNKELLANEYSSDHGQHTYDTLACERRRLSLGSAENKVCEPEWEIDFVKSKLLCWCRPVKLSYRKWHSCTHTCSTASGNRKTAPVIILGCFCRYCMFWITWPNTDSACIFRLLSLSNLSHRIDLGWNFKKKFDDQILIG